MDEDSSWFEEEGWRSSHPSGDEVLPRMSEEGKKVLVLSNEFQYFRSCFFMRLGGRLTPQEISLGEGSNRLVNC